MKMPHEAHVQTAELKRILQKKESLESELQNIRAMVGTFEIQKEKLEYQIQSLKTQVELLSLVDPNFSLVSELGKL